MNVRGMARGRWLLTLVLWLAGAIAVIMGLFSVLHTGFFAHNLSRQMTRRYLAGTPFSVSIDRFTGNPLGDITIRGLKLRYRGADGAFDVLRVDEVQCRYDAASVARKQPLIEELVIVKPVVRLKADSTGAFILPSLGGGPGAFPEIRLDRLLLRDGQAVVQGLARSESVSDVQLRGSVRSTGAKIAVRIDGGSAEDPQRSLTLKRLSGTVLVERDAAAPSPAARSQRRSTFPYRLSFDSLAVSLEETALVLSGTVVPSTRLFDCTVSANPLVIDEVARIAGHPMKPAGEVEGLFSAKGKPDRFHLRGTMNGVLAGYGMSDFKVDLRRENREIRVDSMSGYLNGAPIDGAGTYRERAPQVATFDLAVSDLDLSKGFVPKHSLPETRFNGTVSLRYRIPEEALSFSLNLGEGHFRRFPFQTASVRGSYARDTLALDEIVLTHPAHTVNARGRLVGSDAIDFVFHVDCEARDTLFGYLGIEDYRGDANLDGIWQGTLDRFDVRLSGACGNLRYRMVSADTGSIKLAVRKDRHYSVLFDLDGRGCTIGSSPFAAIKLSLEYADDVTRITRLNLSREGFDAEAEIEIASEKDVNTIRVKRLALDALGESWAGAGRFSIVVGDSIARFDDLELRSRAGALAAGGDLFYRRRAVDARVEFEGLAVELLNRAKLCSVPLAGTARGSLRFDGPYGDPAIDVALAVEGGRVDTLAVDSLRCAIAYAARRSVIDSLSVSSPAGSLRLGGEVAGISLPEVARGHGARGREATVSIHAACRELLVVPLLSLAGYHTFTGGRFSGIVSMSDSLAHPSVDLAGTLTGLAVRSFTIPVVNCSASVDGRELTVEGTLDASGSGPATLRGSIPLAHAPFFYAVDRARPLSFGLEVPDGNFASIPAVTDFVAEGAGRYSLTLRVTGTAGRPHLDGALRLANVSCRLSGMEERYSQVNADVRLEDSVITVASLAGKEGKKGTFDCAGTVVLNGWRPGRYDLSINLKDFVAASVPNALAIMSGTLAVGTTVGEGRVLPVISGSCVVNQADVFYDLGSISSQEAGGTLEPASFLAAVDVSIPGNTWIKTADARVEMRGDITVYHDNRGTNVRGEVDLVRGWYNVYNNKFQIVSGKLQFVRAGGIRPVVDVEAETRDPEGRSIYLTIQWHQDDVEPKLTLRHEDSGYSETDIWKMLGGGIVNAPDQQGGSWDARGTAQNIAANYLERVLNSQMEGLTIELESPTHTEAMSAGALNMSETKIAVGTYLSQGLYVKYKQGLSISTARQIEVEYRISKLLLLRSEVIRYSDKALQGKSKESSDEINLDVKLRWEF